MRIRLRASFLVETRAPAEREREREREGGERESSVFIAFN
jgi:hypothetical protein